LRSASPAERRLAASVAGAVADPTTAAWVAGHLRRLVGIHPTPSMRAPATAADREEEFAAWRRYLHGLAAARPLVLALEDLHRADDALLDFVESLAEGGNAPLLVVATARPELLERRPGWGSAGTTVRLAPLGDADTGGLLAMLLAHHGLPTEVEPGLLGRVAGNPLFAEEYVRMLRDRGDAAALHAAPPPTGVHAIVAARLDALPADERAVLDDAAVVGQVGWVGALGEVGGDLPGELAGPLGRGVAAGHLQGGPGVGAGDVDGGVLPHRAFGAAQAPDAAGSPAGPAAQGAPRPGAARVVAGAAQGPVAPRSRRPGRSA
jgi:hypothetical protein